MRKIVVKGLIFTALNALLAVAVLRIHERGLTDKPWETDSVLQTMPTSTHHDLAFLGTSRTYLLSRFERHHQVTEEILGQEFFNMALPQGGGVTPNQFYLETYLESGNSTDRVIYFLDPFVLFSAGANTNHKFVYFEPFRVTFLAKLIRNGYHYRRILTYVRSKFTAAWLRQSPKPLVHHTAAFPESYLTDERRTLRMESLYPDGLPEDVFKTYTAEFERIVDLCEAHDTPITVVVPPTFIGAEPGHAAMMTWLEELGEKRGIAVHDWVAVMPERTKYYNLDHMNLGGIETFMGGWVKPMLDGVEAETLGTDTAEPVPS
jgi:hypothetical protein